MKELARWLHEQYEEIAAEENWGTQPDCQVDFNDLPANNKRVMLRLSERIVKEWLMADLADLVKKPEVLATVFIDPECLKFLISEDDFVCTIATMTAYKDDIKVKIIKGEE